MRDKHPIDDLFREALRNASAEPPPHLAEAVIGAAQQRRRALAWFRRRYVLGALLLLAVGGVWYWRFAGGVGNQENARMDQPEARDAKPRGAEAVPPVEREKKERLVAAVPAKTEGAVSKGASTSRSRTDARSSSGDAVRENVPSAKTNDPARGEQPGRALVDPVQLAGADVTDVVVPDASPLTIASSSTQSDAVAIDTSPVASASSSILEDATLVRLSPRFPSSEGAIAHPLSAIGTNAYVLPRGDWWIGAHTAFYASHRHWSGGSLALADALNDAEAWTSTVGLGLIGGRAWRSGVGVGMGIESERSEQAYRHVDKATSYESVVNTQMVTLNTYVYYAAADTIITPTVHERVSVGFDSRTTWRIPVEAFWRRSLGRWVVGARCGLAAEFTSVRSSASLVDDEVLGGINATELAPSALNQRYPLTMVGMVGADVGFLLHERWTATASPIYMRGLLNSTGANSLSSSPERAGVRLQLCYTL